MPTTDYSKIPNTLERRATMIVEMLNDKAQHIVDALDEPPPGTQEPSTDQVRDMWTFSPFGDRAPFVYWQLHDLALESLMNEISQMPNLAPQDRLDKIQQAHQMAERSALDKAYPHRSALLMLGVTTPERSVQLAQRASRIAAQAPTTSEPTTPEPMAMEPMNA
jgi:hypothetical protein